MVPVYLKYWLLVVVPILLAHQYFLSFSDWVLQLMHLLAPAWDSHVYLAPVGELGCIIPMLVAGSVSEREICGKATKRHGQRPCLVARHKLIITDSSWVEVGGFSSC